MNSPPGISFLPHFRMIYVVNVIYVIYVVYVDDGLGIRCGCKSGEHHLTHGWQEVREGRD